MKTPTLSSERIIIRYASSDEAQIIAEFTCRNVDHFSKGGPRYEDEHLTISYWQLRIGQYLQEFEDEESIRFFIFHKEDNIVIGTISFTNLIRGVFQCAKLGYKIDAKYEGQGLMTESLGLAIDYIFNELNYHRIEAGYRIDNLRSGRVLEKLGFTKEGVAQDYLLIDGKWQDHNLTSLTNRKWS